MSHVRDTSLVVLAEVENKPALVPLSGMMMTDMMGCADFANAGDVHAEFFRISSSCISEIMTRALSEVTAMQSQQPIRLLTHC